MPAQNTGLQLRWHQVLPVLIERWSIQVPGDRWCHIPGRRSKILSARDGIPLLYQCARSVLEAAPMAKEKPNINGNVDGDDRDSKAELNLARQTRRIDNAEQVVLDKAVCITRLAGPDTKTVLDRSERARATRQLYKECPGYGWKMNQRHPAPPDGKRAAEKGKHDESQMQQQDAISGKTKVHRQAGSREDGKQDGQKHG